MCLSHMKIFLNLFTTPCSTVHTAPRSTSGTGNLIILGGTIQCLAYFYHYLVNDIYIAWMSKPLTEPNLQPTMKGLSLEIFVMLSKRMSWIQINWNSSKTGYWKFYYMGEERASCTIKCSLCIQVLGRRGPGSLKMSKKVLRKKDCKKGRSQGPTLIIG